MLRQLNDKPETFQRSIQIIQINGLAKISVTATLQCGFFHSVNVKSRYGNDRDMLQTLELAKPLNSFQPAAMVAAA